jgi:nucleoside-diphosphate-sugar epimerase
VAKFLVTGGAGFIGSNLVDALVSAGDTVRVLDDLSSGREENLAGNRDRIELLVGSITDPEIVRRAVDGVDYVLHHAALASVPRSVADPWSNHEINVTGTLRVLLAARDAGVRRLVFAASSAAYGDSEEVPKREDMEPAPVSPYAVAKLVGEHYCRQFTASGWLSCVCLRYFNIFGPRQDPGSEYAAVVPIFLSRLLAGRTATIYGDGGQTRDFTHVENAIAANLLAIGNDRAQGGVYNIGCGESFTLLELHARLQEVLGTDLPPRHDPPRAGDVRHSLASIDKARDELGYAPRVGFTEGLERTARWFREQAAATGRGVGS